MPPGRSLKTRRCPSAIRAALAMAARRYYETRRPCFGSRVRVGKRSSRPCCRLSRFRCSRKAASVKLSIVMEWPCQTTQSRTSSKTSAEMRPLVFAFRGAVEAKVCEASESRGRALAGPAFVSTAGVGGVEGISEPVSMGPSAHAKDGAGSSTASVGAIAGRASGLAETLERRT